MFVYATAGCLAPMDPKQSQLVEIDEVTVLGQVSSYRSTTMFEPISKPYPSALTDTAAIEVYVTRTAAVPFSNITPDVTGSNAVIPEGGTIVREVLDANGVAQRLTVMSKGPAGYNPDLGDWFFAVTDLKGVPVLEDGVQMSGRIGDCFSCHTPRMTDDYLFGVPLADRVTGTGSGSGSGSMPPQGGTMPVCGDFACEMGETKTTCPHDCDHHHH